MASRFSYLVFLAAWIAVLWWGLDFARTQSKPRVAVPTQDIKWADFFTANILPQLPDATEFDTPLRPPDGEGATITLPYLFQNQHLGEDWSTAKGDAALGEPVYSVADGWVSVAQDFEGAWGKVVFIDYRLPGGRWPSFVEVMYAQLNSMDVQAGQFVKRGQRIGAVGNANGTYSVAGGGAGAHLHWEIRQTVGMGLGPGFQAGATGWLGPSEFIKAHRGDRANQPLLPKVLGDADRQGWGNDY